MRKYLPLGCFLMTLVCFANLSAAEIHDAVDSGDISKVRKLLQQAEILEARDSIGRTPLIHSAAANRLEILKLLLQKGAEINATDNEGKSALFFAAMDENATPVKLLLAAGAKVNAASSLGETPLMQAAASNRTAIVRLLLAANADYNAKTKSNRTALMHASWQAVQIENPEVIRDLIAAGADVNAADERGTTALMLAAAMHQTAIVSILLDAKANVNALNQENEAALIYVPQNEETVEEAIAVVRKLSEAGADLNVRQNKGQTALIIAASRCSPRLVQTLMELKADANIRDNSGQTAFENACKTVWAAKGRERIQAMLRGEAENKPVEILIGKVFSVDGKKLIITGKGIGKITVGRKLRIKAASGDISATTTETLHSKVKARAEKRGVAAGDPVYSAP